jgi:sugar phosphate permease
MESLRHWQFRIFGATWLAYAALYLCRKNFSVIMPLLRAEGVSADLLASSIAVYSAFYCLGQFTSGLLSDKFGARRVVFFGMMVSAAATASLGIFPLSATVIWLQALNGFAQACGWPGVLKLMAAWFPPERRGRVMSWWGSHLVVGGFVSTLFATYAATGPVLVAMGWRRAVWAPAIALAGFALLFWLLARDRETGSGSKPRVIGGVAEVLQSPAIRAISAMYLTVKCARYVFLFWLPTYMTERLNYSADEAGYTSSVFEVAGFGGVLAAGYLSDRWFGGRRFPVGSLAMLLLAAACLLHPSLASLGRWGNILGIALIGALTFGADSLMSGAGTQDAVRTEVAATAGGVTNMIGSLGQIISAPLAAQVSSRFGWDSVFYVLVILALAGSAALSTQWRFTAQPLRSASAA